ncbi:pilus assembly protein [Desulfotalea psychrophila]|uniref:pilus assembly protein n=1 Tax=Desulfotalea psychrophila TaxID=84980 RepID=UPI00031073F8|nr:PilC/PilY family type IV pilus protein [Desulfotalea psychrophila]
MKYAQVSCQAKVLVIVTDGIGNTGTTTTNAGTATDRLINAGVSVVALGFGLDNATQLDKIAEIAQRAGKISDTDKLYALHDDAGGKGVPFLADSPDEFLAAMKSIISSVKLQLYNGVSPAPTTSVKDEQILVTATFNPAKWTGDVVANKFDGETGKLGEILWRASDVYASAGSPDFADCFVYEKATTSVVNYGTTTLDKDNYLCKNLGDIINSTPKIVGAPPYYYDFDDYEDFNRNTSVTGRDTLVYVNSNDGALHSFLLAPGTSRASTDTTPLGKELWRFYPDSVREKLNTDMCSAAYCHEYINDGPPRVGDIYKADLSGSKWRTVLAAGIGRGGAGFYSLDVTYGKGLGGGVNDTSFLWEFTSVDDSELGLATALPEIERVADDAVANKASWLTFFGSGRAVKADEQASKQAYLFAVNSWTGASVWGGDNNTNKIKIGTADPADDSQLLKNDIPSSPLVVDVDDDNKADRVYLGNLYGEIFRIADISVGDSPRVSRLFESGHTDRLSPIITKPAFAFDSDTGSSLWVYAGTGKYEDQADKVSSDQQYMLGLLDEGASLRKMSEITTCDAGFVTAADSSAEYRTVGNCVTGAGGAGSWALKLMNSESSASERSLSQPLVVGGVVFFTTFVPDADVCGGSGDAYLFALDWKTGAAPTEHIFVDFPQTVGSSAVAGLYLGKGVPFQPVLHGDVLFAGTTEQPPTPYKVNLKKSKIELKSWRQDFN